MLSIPSTDIRRGLLWASAMKFLGQSIFHWEINRVRVSAAGFLIVYTLKNTYSWLA